MALVVDTLALGAGVAAAFNPCGVALLPSYLAFLLGRPAAGAWPTATAQGLAAGVLMTAGLLVPFGVIALMFGAVAGWLGPHLSSIGLLLGAAVALWGLATLVWPNRMQLALPLPHAGTGARGVAGVFAYGTVFGLASVSCAFPVFLALLVQATTAGGAMAGIGLVLLYALGMGAVITGLSVLARTATEAARHVTHRAAALSGRLSGAIILLSGVAVVLYWSVGLPL